MEDNFIKKCIEEFILGKAEKEFEKYNDYSVKNSLLMEDEDMQYVYNEMSFQHELGEYLRARLEKLEGNYRVQFERNKVDFGIENNIGKSEIDIVIIDIDNNKYYAIELKYHKSERQRYPDTMFDCVKDIDFIYKLVNNKESKFEKGYCVTIAEDERFYKAKGQNNCSEKLYNNYWCFKDIGDIKDNYTVKKSGKNEDQIINIKEYVNQYKYLPIRENEKKETSSWKRICDINKANETESKNCKKARYYIIEINKE